MRIAIDPPRIAAHGASCIQQVEVYHARHIALGSWHSDPHHHPSVSLPRDL